MGEHKRQGKTFFVSHDTYNYICKTLQYAVHRAPSGHYSYIIYVNGVQQGKASRCTQEKAAKIMGISVKSLQDLFKLE